MFYAGIGDSSWDHLQLHTRLDPRPGSAGIAVGINAAGSQVQQAIVATVEAAAGAFALVLRSRSGGNVTELARATVAVSGPILLDITVFDDVVRAGVGDTVIAAPPRSNPRGPCRPRRQRLADTDVPDLVELASGRYVMWVGSLPRPHY
jgi:hypothetical protein